MDVEQVAQKGDGGPGFLGIPSPIGAPSDFGPNTTEQEADHQKAEAGIDEIVANGKKAGQVDGFSFVLPPNYVDRNKEGCAKKGVGEDVRDDVGHEIRTFEGGHHRLVVNLGFEDIDEHKDGGENARKAENPNVTPANIDHQTGDDHEEGVPQAGFAHRAKGRTL